MFTEITMINYDRPLTERAKTRKFTGPYRWRPTAAPSKGRGFYQGKGLFMDRHGSTFDLRIEDANNHLRGTRLAHINGYYCDDFQSDTLQPIIARLPHGRGFLAGWTMGAGMCASLEADIWPTEEEAARAAHDEAERAAEREREYQAQQEAEETLDTAEDAFRDSPNAETAAAWLETAESYEHDDMIQADELASIRAETAPYLAG